mmetsp:Transcript_54179/g.117044  ORF Transcript_54179/g.117044 Transcript_54179/m.117044 type:complete len:216 (-) Transcript_54179:960-1607(-)
MVMASATALEPSAAFFTVSRFSAFSCFLAAVWLARSSVSIDMAAVSSATSACNLPCLDSSTPSSPPSSFTSVCLRSRVIFAWPSCSSQKPFLVASSVASLSRRSMRSWMSCFTLSKGSPVTRDAIAVSISLFNFTPAWRSNAAAFWSLLSELLDLRDARRTVERRACRKEGSFEASPGCWTRLLLLTASSWWTWSLRMVNALPRAASSSARVRDC